MSVLLPRLDSREASKLRSAFLENPNGASFNSSLFEDMLQHRSAFPATGGIRLTADELIVFRKVCLSSLDSSIMPNFGTHFDLEMGRLLKDFGLRNRSDMGTASVWDFLSLVLLPDVIAKRLGSMNAGSKGLRSRLTGGDRRHQLQRLWKRRIVLGDEIVDAQLLTEDDYVQLLERNITLERSALTKSVAYQIVNSGYSGDKRRQYARTMMKFLLQMSGLVHFSESDTAHLESATAELHKWTIEQLEGERSTRIVAW